VTGEAISSHIVQKQRCRDAAGGVSSPIIYILAFVRDPHIQLEFLRACRSLGFTAEVITTSSLERHKSPIVITDGDHAVQKEIADALLSKGVIASLSLLKNGLSWNDQLLSVSRDIDSWPVDLPTLAFKLGHAVFNPNASYSHQPIPGFEGLSDLNLLGESASFRACMQRIRMYAQSDAPVLICGETGTGKELSAQALHYLSERREGPLVPLNCGAVPESLFENELFGHAKGAYTDARSRYRGLVEQADGGTLFLDEVDTLTPRSQVALLRFLQDFTFRSLGTETNRKVNIRLISASNQDFGNLAAQGHFRNDLIYRLDVLELYMPPLRERVEDIELLSRHFVEKYQTKYQKCFHGFDAYSMQWLKQQHWPGNIRELEHHIHRAVVLSQGSMLTLSDEHSNNDTADRDYQYAKNFKTAKAAAIARFEKEYLCRLLEECHGNVTEAAARSGKERRALGKLIKKYSIDRQQYTNPSLS